MSVNSIGSSAAYTAALHQQSNVAAAQPVRRDTGNDGDKDDVAAAVKAPSPTVNLNGQTVGSTINITA